MSFGVVLAASILLAVLRVGGLKPQWFQAIAHLFVGGVATAAWLQGSARLGWIILALSLVELACFMVDHFGRHMGSVPDERLD